MGTPDFAVPTLLRLAAHGHEIAAVYTRAAKPAGRGMKLQPTPVEPEARRLGLAGADAGDAEDAGRAGGISRAIGADAAVVVAYGMILPQAILDAPRLGCFNLHASLLPRWRGAAPINRAIMAGDAETGVMVMKMDAGLDTGDVAMAERIAITDAMTAADLHDALAPLGADSDGARDGRAGTRQAATHRQSDQGVTYAAKIDKAETRIDWNRPARAVLRHIHGLSPFPGAWCEIAIEASRRGSRSCAAKSPMARARRRTARRSPQRSPARKARSGFSNCSAPARQPMKAEEFLRGTPLPPGARLGVICPATNSSSNMTARRFAAGRSRTMAPRCRARWRRRSRRSAASTVRVHGAGRTDAGVHALAQVAHCDIAKHFVPGRLRDGLNAHLRPHPIGVLSRGDRARYVRGAVLGQAAALSLSHRQSPRQSRARHRPRLAAAAPARYRRDARSRAAAGRQARFHDLSRHRMPGEIAGENPRSARCHRERAMPSTS